MVVMDIKIIDANGWSKLFEIKKAITQIGSASYIDIQLPSASIAPLQLQILANPSLPTSCRIVNMAARLEVINNKSVHNLESHTTYDVNSGDEIQLGEYRIIFQLPLATIVQQTSNCIEASVSFQDTILQPYLSLDGLLTVKNVGGKDGCQFQVEIAGLPENCYRIDPIPLLYSGAQEEVRLRLFHNTIYPQAGFHNLLISIKAPDTYPSEALVIKQGIFVAPVFRQSIEIIDEQKDTFVRIMQTDSDSQFEDFAETENTSHPTLNLGEPEDATITSNAEQKTNIITQEPGIEKQDVPIPVQTDVQIQESKPIEMVVEKREKENKPIATKPKKTKKAQPVKNPISQNEPESDLLENKLPEKSELSVSQELDLKKVKVIRKQTEQYWDEK
jgi:hypothetical protein